MFCLFKSLYIDELTGVWNLRYLNKKVKLNKYRYLYFFDINNLGKINKNEGFIAGNKTIKFVVNFILTRCESRDILARVGGDEFVALTTGKRTFLKHKSFVVGSVKQIQKSLEELMQEASLEAYEKKDNE